MQKIEENKDEMQGKNRVKLAILIIATTIGVYVSFRYFLPFFVPFLIAYFISKLLLPIVNFLNRRLKIRRTIAGFITLSLGFALIGTGIFALIRTLFIQAGMFFRNFPIYQAMITRNLDVFCKNIDKFFGIACGSAKTFALDAMDQVVNTIQTKIVPAMTEHTISATITVAQIVMVIVIIFMAVLLIIKDQKELKSNYENMIFYKDVHKVTGELANAGIAYVKAQLILMAIIGTICSIAFFVLHNKYALLIGIFIGVFDAFPVLGSGLILVPWAIVELLSGDLFTAVVLATLYFSCELIREFLEPKLVGDRIGLKPIYTLMSIYVGIQLFSVMGFFLGPIGLILIQTIVKEFGEIKTIKK